MTIHNAISSRRNREKMPLLDKLKNALKQSFPSIDFIVGKVEGRPVVRWQGDPEPEEVKTVMVRRGIPKSGVTYFKSEVTIREE
jgi:hypothetical protein